MTEFDSSAVSETDDNFAVILETINPLDVTHEDLEELAQAVERSDVGARVALAYDDQHGAGVTGLEVVHAWVTYGLPVTLNLVASVIAEFTKWQLKRRRKPHHARRGSLLVIIDKETGEEREVWILEPEAQTPAKRPDVSQERRRRPKGRHRG